MNYSLSSADRATHLKIVVAALFLGATVAGVGLLLHIHSKAPPAEHAAVYKAKAPIAASASITIVR